MAIAAKPQTASNDFAEFVGQHTDGLLTTAYLLTRDRDRAQELLQDVLVRLYPHWHKVAAAESPVAYVRRSVVNRFLSQRKRRLELVTDRVPERSDPGDGDRLLDRDQLRRMLATLPERQRAALVLRFFYDYPDARIAEAMGCRVGTVRSLISRALASLRATRSSEHELRGEHR
ncbi:MAG TPA: SigE family RNA polymerase sigma factor [Jatrophihabitans sp.]|nr:SigE family RNA polymerase sigma factor [Jatrophihabitans sp.]